MTIVVHMSEENEGNRVSIVSTYHRKRGTCMVTVRVPQALVDNMDRWVEDDHFKSRSDFIVTAIRRYLDELSKAERVAQEYELRIGNRSK